MIAHFNENLAQDVLDRSAVRIVPSAAGQRRIFEVDQPGGPQLLLGISVDDRARLSIGSEHTLSQRHQHDAAAVRQPCAVLPASQLGGQFLAVSEFDDRGMGLARLVDIFYAQHLFLHSPGVAIDPLDDDDGLRVRVLEGFAKRLGQLFQQRLQASGAVVGLCQCILQLILCRDEPDDGHVTFLIKTKESDQNGVYPVKRAWVASIWTTRAVPHPWAPSA